MREFHRKLGETLQVELGLPVARSFTPHLTLGYDEKIIPEHPIQPVSWTVRDFVLIQSSVGRSHYTTIGRWIFRG